MTDPILIAHPRRMMSAHDLAGPGLTRFRCTLEAVYRPGRIERVMLLGSRARGDAGPESDDDVFLRDMAMADRRAEMERLVQAVTALRKFGVVLLKRRKFHHRVTQRT